MIFSLLTTKPYLICHICQWQVKLNMIMYRKALKLKGKFSLTQSSLYPNTSSVHFYLKSLQLNKTGEKCISPFAWFHPKWPTSHSYCGTCHCKFFQIKTTLCIYMSICFVLLACRFIQIFSLFNLSEYCDELLSQS